MKWLQSSLCGLVALIAVGTQAAETDTVAVLGALPSEVALLEARLEVKQTQVYLGIEFQTGVLAGRRVVLARSGMGKVNAAMVTSLLVDRFHPSVVIFSGLAGGLNPNLAPGDIVIGERTAQYDYGEWNAQGFKTKPTVHPVTGHANPEFFEAPAKLVARVETAAQTVAFDRLATTQGERVPRVMRGVIVTGDAFVANAAKNAELRNAFHADAVEMEGAAVAQVCAQAGVPCMEVRCISDRTDAGAMADFAKFLKQAGQNSAKFTLAIFEQLAKP